MLKETEAEETIGFVVTFHHWWHFNRGARPLGPLWLRLCTFCSAKAQQVATE